MRAAAREPASSSHEWNTRGSGTCRQQDRILRVESRVVAAGLDLAVQLVGAGLGEDLDAAVAQAVVLGGKWILVDADFADRRLRRNLAAGESVDINLSAVGARRRTGQRLQFALQFVGIVGERVQVLALDDDGVGVVLGAVPIVFSASTCTCCCTSICKAGLTFFIWPAATAMLGTRNAAKPSAVTQTE